MHFQTSGILSRNSKILENFPCFQNYGILSDFQNYGILSVLSGNFGEEGEFLTFPESRKSFPGRGAPQFCYILTLNDTLPTSVQSSMIFWFPPNFPPPFFRKFSGISAITSLSRVPQMIRTEAGVAKKHTRNQNRVARTFFSQLLLVVAIIPSKAKIFRKSQNFSFPEKRRQPYLDGLSFCTFDWTNEQIAIHIHVINMLNLCFITGEMRFLFPFL